VQTVSIPGYNINVMTLYMYATMYGASAAPGGKLERHLETRAGAHQEGAAPAHFQHAATTGTASHMSSSTLGRAWHSLQGKALHNRRESYPGTYSRNHFVSLHLARCKARRWCCSWPQQPEVLEARLESLGLGLGLGSTIDWGRKWCSRTPWWSHSSSRRGSFLYERE